jgi:uncharacterized membrane protein YphA (DoxX/SURF4 family)
MSSVVPDRGADLLKPSFELTGRVLLGGLLVFAGVAKFGQPALEFQGTTFFRIVKTDLGVNAIAILEISVGLWIALTQYVRISWMMLWTIFSAFAIVLWHGVWLGKDVGCGCDGPAQSSRFGAGESGLIWSAARNSMVAFGAMLVSWALHFEPLSTDKVSSSTEVDVE